MYYHIFMYSNTTSISSRGLVYISKEIQEKIKLLTPGRLEICLVDEGILLKPVKDIMDFAGIAKNKAKYKYWKNFRGKMEENYEEVY